jgi:exonuclease VII small subunit
MRAMMLEGPGRTLRLLERAAEPAPGSGQVLIRVGACGVCRTDLHIVDGELPRPKRNEQTEVEMLCAELERLEAQLNDVLAALENPKLTEQQRHALEDAYARMSHIIMDHQKSGHEGAPCFEE